MPNYHNNLRYAELADVYLKDLIKMRLANEHCNGNVNVTGITILSKENGQNTNEPFKVKYKVSVENDPNDDTFSLVFSKFFIDEWDYIHEIFERMKMCPASEYLLKKINTIVNLECSNRGWMETTTNLKNRIKTLYDSVSFK